MEHKNEHISLADYAKKYLKPTDKIVFEYYWHHQELNSKGDYDYVCTNDGLPLYERDNEYSFELLAKDIDSFYNTYEFVPEFILDLDMFERVRHYSDGDYYLYRVCTNVNKDLGCVYDYDTELHVIVFNYL
jgi:hypothetical protein